MRQMTRVRIGLLALLSMGLFACASDGVGGAAGWQMPYPPTGYAHHIGSNPLDLYWNCARPGPSVLQMDGLAVNALGDAEVLFLKIELAGVNARGLDVSSAKFESPNIQIWMRESQPFRMDLPTTGAEVRFDLYYEYGYHGGGEGTDTPRGFLPDGRGALLAAAGNFPILLAQGTRNVVRDACSPTQHLAR
jgi:hypothetical protein